MICNIDVDSEYINKNFKWSVNDNAVSIVRFIGDASENNGRVVIPKRIDNLLVTKIEMSAFEGLEHAFSNDDLDKIKLINEQALKMIG